MLKSEKAHSQVILWDSVLCGQLATNPPSHKMFWKIWKNVQINRGLVLPALREKRGLT